MLESDPQTIVVEKDQIGMLFGKGRERLRAIETRYGIQIGEMNVKRSRPVVTPADIDTTEGEKAVTGDCDTDDIKNRVFLRVTPGPGTHLTEDILKAVREEFVYVEEQVRVPAEMLQVSSDGGSWIDRNIGIVRDISKGTRTNIQLQRGVKSKFEPEFEPQPHVDVLITSSGHVNPLHFLNTCHHLI